MKRIDVKELAEALKAAAIAAQAASQGEDGGTCNLDSVILRVPKGTRFDTIKSAAVLAGINVSETTWFGRGFFLNFDVRGQGNARSRGAEAASHLLQERGYRTSMYYQMD